MPGGTRPNLSKIVRTKDGVTTETLTIKDIENAEKLIGMENHKLSIEISVLNDESTLISNRIQHLKNIKTKNNYKIQNLREKRELLRTNTLSNAEYKLGDMVIITNLDNTIGKVVDINLDSDNLTVRYNIEVRGRVGCWEEIDVPEISLSKYDPIPGVKSVIIEFLKEKNKLINNYLGYNIDYIGIGDIVEVKNWPLSDCIKVIEHFANVDFKTAGDVALCPWCVINDRDCCNCGYGQRNGICNISTNSAYNKTIESIRDRRIELKQDARWSSIINIPAMSELKLVIITKCKCLLDKLSNMK